MLLWVLHVTFCRSMLSPTCGSMGPLPAAGRPCAARCLFHIDMNCVVSDLFLQGVFYYVPPVRAGVLPGWSLDVLLGFLLGPSLGPLGSASFLRILQNAFYLILLASGRRIGVMCFLSHSDRPLPSGLGLSLSWVAGSFPKVHTPLFPAASPICRLTSGVPRDHLLCPFQAYNVLISCSLDLIEDIPLTLRRHRLWVNPRTILSASK